MNRISKLTIGVLWAGVSSYSPAAHALDVKKVQLGIKVEKSGNCPRKAIMKLWAHTDGPGVVKFVIHNSSGGSSGELIAQTAPGAVGTHLATYDQIVNITTDVNTKYRISVVGQSMISNWVPMVAECGPKVRTKTSTKASDAKPAVKKAADAGKPKVRTETSTKASDAKPRARTATDDVADTKPTGNSGAKPKPIGKTCKKQRITISRYSATSKAIGLGSARLTWAAAVTKKYGFKWRQLKIASKRSETCKRHDIIYFVCTVSARPCRKN